LLRFLLDYIDLVDTINAGLVALRPTSTSLMPINAILHSIMAGLNGVNVDVTGLNAIKVGLTNIINALMPVKPALMVEILQITISTYICIYKYVYIFRH